MTQTVRTLDGMRVLDFSQVLAGPAATRLTADLGADVIKVELAPGGEGSRLPPYLKNGRSGFSEQPDEPPLQADDLCQSNAAMLHDLLGLTEAKVRHPQREGALAAKADLAAATSQGADR